MENSVVFKVFKIFFFWNNEFESTGSNRDSCIQSVIVWHHDAIFKISKVWFQGPNPNTAKVLLLKKKFSGFALLLTGEKKDNYIFKFPGICMSWLICAYIALHCLGYKASHYNIMTTFLSLKIIYKVFWILAQQP